MAATQADDHPLVVFTDTDEAGVDTGASLLEMFYELDRMGATLPSAEELARAKRYQGGLYLLRNQIQGSVAQTLATNWVNGLPPEALGEFVPTVNAVTALVERHESQGQLQNQWFPVIRLFFTNEDGQLFLDERSLWPDGKFVTTNVVVRKEFMDQHPDLVSKFLQAHVDTIQYIKSNPSSAQSIVNSEIKRITGKALPGTVIASSFTNLDIIYDPLVSTLMVSADRAYSLGFLGSSKPDLSGIYDLAPLNQVLTKKGLATVSGS